MSEIFEIVDECDVVTGTAPRSECHGNPGLVHRTAHVVVISRAGELLLQKRSQHKDIQPGKWDTAVGGHLAVGETYEQAACREMKEEIGVAASGPLIHLFDGRIRNEIESENVRVFRYLTDGPFVVDDSEIDAVRFWPAADLDATLGTGIFTPNLEAEIGELRHRGFLA